VATACILAFILLLLANKVTEGMKITVISTELELAFFHVVGTAGQHAGTAHLANSNATLCIGL
jgi:hypothetical protein